MALLRLGRFTANVSKENGIFLRYLAARTNVQNLKNEGGRSKDDVKAEEDLNAPVRFTGTKAASWSARETRSGTRNDQLWYQPYVISLSLAVFLIYFCILREENDIDQKLEKTLYEHIRGLEEHQIVMAIAYNSEQGKDVSALKARLKELRREGR